MTRAITQILEDALRLRPIQKAELIDKLFHSFDHATDHHIDEAWSDEIESRIDAYDNGKISATGNEILDFRFTPNDCALQMRNEPIGRRPIETDGNECNVLSGEGYADLLGTPVRHLGVTTEQANEDIARLQLRVNALFPFLRHL